MLDKIISLTVLAAEAAGIVWLWKFTHKPPKRYVDIAPLTDKIERLAAMARHVSEIDEMLLDVRSCKEGELIRMFRLDWLGDRKQNKSIELAATGKNGVSRSMIAAAEDDRERTCIDFVRLFGELAAEIADAEQEVTGSELQVLTPSEPEQRVPTSSEIVASCTKLAERYGTALERRNANIPDMPFTEQFTEQGKRRGGEWQ